MPTLLALHALPPEFADRRDDYVAMIADEMIPRAAPSRAGDQRRRLLRKASRFTPEEVERVFTAAQRQRASRSGSTPSSSSNQSGAALAADYKALSADHLEHLDDAGAKAMAEAGTVAVLLPGAFYALQETKKPPVELLRKHKVPIAIATDCNPGTSPMLSPTLTMNMACTLFGLTPEEALAGMTVNAARALGVAHEAGSIAAGKAADLCVWRIEASGRAWLLDRPAGPERLAGRDAFSPQASPQADPALGLKRQGKVADRARGTHCRH